MNIRAVTHQTAAATRLLPAPQPLPWDYRAVGADQYGPIYHQEQGEGQDLGATQYLERHLWVLEETILLEQRRLAVSEGTILLCLQTPLHPIILARKGIFI